MRQAVRLACVEALPEWGPSSSLAKKIRWRTAFEQWRTFDLCASSRPAPGCDPNMSLCRQYLYTLLVTLAVLAVALVVLGWLTRVGM